MSIRPKLSRIVANQLPEFIREDYPTFVAFLEAYYEYLEQNGANLYDLRDIDKTLDRFIEYFRNELAPHAFDTTNTDKRFLYANIKDAHLAKGSEASFKLLFRLLFNKNVSVDYPGRQMLRASDGKWNQDVSVFARVNAGDPNEIVGKLVDVITPNRVIRVLVDRRQDVEIEVDRFVQISPDIYEFYIDRRFFGDLSVGDRLRYDGVFDATIVATTAKLDILQKGRNFRPGQLYPIKNGNGSGSIVKIKTTDNNGGILAAEYVKYGVGYETDFTATVLAAGGQTTTGAGQTALSISNISSAVTSIEVTSGGSGYDVTPPIVALSGGGFTTAATIGELTIVDGVITNIEVATPGSGYVTAPTVIIAGGSGTGAAATANIGQQSGYGIFETTTGFNEQGYINAADYVQDVSNIWLPRTTYVTGDQLYYQNRLYDVTVGGLTSSTPPSHTSGDATNGTVTLTYNRLHGAAWDGTYSGEIIREFFFDSRDSVVDPDDPAIFKITLGPLTKYPGYYKNNDGFLNDAIFIQDSRYYQAYSYVLKIDERLESYKSIVKTLIHPSGLALFGEYDIRNEFDISVSLQSMVKILVVNVQDEFTVACNITSKDFGKALEDFTDEMAEVTTLAINKPLADNFTPQDSIPTLAINKSLANSTNGFVEVRTFGLSKPLEDAVIPSDVVSSLDMEKAVVDSFPLADAHTLSINKPLSDTLDEPLDTISAKDFGKSLSSVLNQPIDAISSIGVSKPLSHSINTPTDSAVLLLSKPVSDSFALSDTTTTIFTKYISDSLSPVDGGNLFFNPYVADPYPSNYWGSDYTTGESTF
jgi:hypothetical protein